MIFRMLLTAVLEITLQDLDWYLVFCGWFGNELLGSGFFSVFT